MKKTLIFVVLFFLLVGAVAASENLTNDTHETLSVEQTQTDNLTLVDDADVLKNETPTDTELQETHDNPAPLPAKPTITAYSVTAKQGQYITLKAVVKNWKENNITTVTFKLNGQTYTAKIVDGVATKTIKCPASAYWKTVTKKTSKKLKKTKYYSKTYTGSASLKSGETSSFKVVSKKDKVVKKYRIVKKQKTMTKPLKKGSKTYKKGKYRLYTYKGKQSGYTVFGALMAKKGTSGTIKFKIKVHFKENGRWKWSSWIKIPKNTPYTDNCPSFIKVNKIKTEYTQVSYKRIS